MYRLNYFKFLIKNKDFEKLLLIIFIYLLILTVNLLSSKKNKYEKLKIDSLFYTSILTLLLCFIYGGMQSRYGGNFLLAIFLFTVSVKYRLLYIDKISKSYKIFIALGLVFISIKNINRIKSEYTNSTLKDKYDYPLVNFDKKKYTTSYKFLKKINISNHPIYCFNIEMLCTTKSTFESIETIKQKGGYYFIISDEKAKIQSINLEKKFINNEYYKN